MKRMLLVIILTAFAVARITYAEDPPTMLWDEIYDSGNDDWSTDVVVDAAGSIYVTGKTYNGTDLDWLTIKYNPDGDTVWTRSNDNGIEDDEGLEAAADNEGNIYVAGWVTGSTNPDWAIIKYDTDGNVVWDRLYDSGVGNDFAVSIASDASANVYVAGWIPGSSTVDPRIAKYDTDGNELWAQTYDSGVNEAAYGIAVDALGFVYAIGHVHNGVDWDWLTLKFDPFGNLVWDKTYDSGKEDAVSYGTIGVDETGNVYVAGAFVNDSTPSTVDWRVICYDSFGNIAWNKTIDFGNDDGATDVTVDTAGFIYVSGNTWNASDADWYTVKYDTDGNIVWETIYDSGGEDKSDGVAVDAAGHVYVTGHTVNADNDCLTIKYEQHTSIAEQSPSSEPSSITLEITENLSPTPTINYSIPAGQHGMLTFYSADGRKLKSFTLDPAQSAFTWVTDYSSGVYFARLVTETGSITRKLLITK